MSEANGPRTNHGPRTRGKDTTPLTVADKDQWIIGPAQSTTLRGFGITQCLNEHNCRAAPRCYEACTTKPSPQSWAAQADVDTARGK